MELIGQMTAVAGVLALLMAALWWLRRRGLAQSAILLPRGRRRDRLERLERLALSPQHTLHLVRLGDTTLLVAASPAGCCLLRSLPCAALEGNAAHAAGQAGRESAR
jgi:flagellar biogenesis protein FliO